MIAIVVFLINLHFLLIRENLFFSMLFLIVITMSIVIIGKKFSVFMKVNDFKNYILIFFPLTWRAPIIITPIVGLIAYSSK